ncbi:unnamed protein product [Symbiodinium natans]|uniref:SET domain-containing protein n=1 Tax=Symbiodinium natans TaxID=878477 RepID=A0A812R9K0_9DINO|nr:unnamed protein product [Symbiodinium natans]
MILAVLTMQHATLSVSCLSFLMWAKGKKPDVVQEVQKVTVPGGMTDEQLAELEDLRAKAAELEKLKAKLKKRDAQIAALQEENDKLNEEQVRLLKMLKQVREQLRIVMELAEKKGLGDVIKKLFEEAGLGATMSDPDYTCFDRLYDDALRRMDKQRRLEWYRLGNTGEPPPSFKVAPFLHPGLCRKVCTDKGRGQGVFSSRPIRSGELLLACRPLAAVQGVPERQLSAALAEQILERLGRGDPEFVADFWSLSDGGDQGLQSDSGEGSEGGEELPGTARRKRKRPERERRTSDKAKVLRIIAVNAHGWPCGDAKGLGLWQWQAYMNHAAPAYANCSAAFAGEVILMRALKGIEAGEECVHSYCPPSASFSVRRAVLRHCGVPEPNLDEVPEEGGCGRAPPGPAGKPVAGSRQDGGGYCGAARRREPKGTRPVDRGPEPPRS